MVGKDLERLEKKTAQARLDEVWEENRMKEHNTLPRRCLADLRF